MDFSHQSGSQPEGEPPEPSRQRPIIELRRREKGGAGRKLGGAQKAARKRQFLFVPRPREGQAEQKLSLRRRVQLRRRVRKARRRRLEVNIAQQRPTQDLVETQQMGADGEGQLVQNSSPGQFEELLEPQLSEFLAQNRPRHRQEGKLILFAVALLFLGMIQLGLKLFFVAPEDTTNEFARSALWEENYFVLSTQQARDLNVEQALDSYQGKSLYPVAKNNPRTGRAFDAKFVGYTGLGFVLYQADWLEGEGEFILKLSPSNERGRAWFLKVTREPAQ